MQEVKLMVDDEIKALGDGLNMLIADIKAGKTAAQITADVLPQLIQAVGGFQQIGADVKKVDNQLYLVKSIAAPLEG